MAEMNVLRLPNRNECSAAVLQVNQYPSRRPVPSISGSICQLVSFRADRTAGLTRDCCFSLPRFGLGSSVVSSLFIAPTASGMSQMLGIWKFAPTAFGIARMGSRMVVLRGMI